MRFPTKVEFIAGYIKTHSLPHKILAFSGKTILKKLGTECLSKCQNLQFASSKRQKSLVLMLKE